MMNIIAIAMLLSSLGLVMVMLPESIFVMSSLDGENVLESTKKKVEVMVASNKDTLEEGVEVVIKPVEKSKGWFRRKPKPKDHFKIAKEKITITKESIQEASTKLKDAIRENLSFNVENVKEKATNTYNGIGKLMFENVWGGGLLESF
jgi:hypothetical protein